MVCQLDSKKKVSSVVVTAISEELGKPDVTAKSRIDRDLGLTPTAARVRLYDPIADAIVARGCSARRLRRSHIQAAKRVEDIVKKAWESVEDDMKEKTK